MPYFRIDDAFPSHRKVLAIPRKERVATVGLWTLAGIWCAGQLTDGHLGEHMVEELGSTKKYADLLVKVGLWERSEDGYVFHDFVYWQGASREEVLAKRAEEAERKRKWREAKAAKRAQGDAGVPDVSQRDNPGTDNGTTASVREESGKRPAGVRSYPPHTLPSPPHPLVPVGDKDEWSSREGDVQEADAHASNDPPPPEPPLCRRHIGWDRDSVPACAACGRLRAQWETDRADADRPPRRPTWCGACDEHTRLLELDDRTVTRCPDCHPNAIGAVA